MRHLFLTTTFPPETGGIARYLEGLAGAVAARGEDVEVAASDVDGVTSGGASGRGYEVRDLGSVDRPLGKSALGRIPVVSELSSALLHLRRYAHGRRTAATLAESAAAGPFRVYVGVWNEIAHGWCSGLRREGIPYRLFAYGLEVIRPLDVVRRGWRVRDFRSAEKVYACSHATARLLERELGELETRVVHPGISEPGDRKQIERTAGELRRELGIGEDETVLVTVSRLVRRKGVHRVLRALGSIDLDGESVRYVVAGDGPERAPLLRLRRELGLDASVDFLGSVDERVKWSVYELGDLFVLPVGDDGRYDWEGFGIVFLEAAVMGLPAVAGRSGGVPEALAHGETGYLVSAADREELTGAIRRLVADRDARVRMGAAARRRALTEFTWERAAARLLGTG